MTLVETGLARLSEQLPLAARQSQLDDVLRAVHRSILWSFVRTGEAAGVSPSAAERLAADDLVVVDDSGRVAGAYPFTTEATDHRLRIDGVAVGAMCSLDAVAVAPVFEVATEVRSRCHVTGVPVAFRQTPSGEPVAVDSDPSELVIGIRWQQPEGCAAHSMCRDMVFLENADVAGRWQDGDEEGVGLFPMSEAVEFGLRFFGPLVGR
jgi:hypothetical protein